MNYELQCEGFPLDDELEDRLLLCGRQLVLDVGGNHAVRMAVKQVDGLVQGRVELALPRRRLSVIVRRQDPIAAMQAAIGALRETLESEGCREALESA